MALAILMVMSLAGAAFATDPAEPEETGGGRVGREPGDTIITINGTSTGSTYQYYRLMEVTVSTDEQHYSYVPKNDKIRGVFRTVLKLADDANDEAILAALRDITTESSASAQLAKDLYAELVKQGIDFDGTATLAADGKTATINQKYGYFLIVQTATGSGEGSATSALLLDTAAKPTVTINTKVKKPSSEKHVFDNNDSAGGVLTGEQDGADWDIGDYVPFDMKGTVVEDISEYSKIDKNGNETGHYWMVFHDTPSASLTYDAANADITVKINHQDAATKSASAAFIQVPSTRYKIINNPGGSCGCPFHVEIDLLHMADGETDAQKIVDLTAHPGDYIRVDFKLKLNDSAVVGAQGNPNTSWMQYSNNPSSNTFGETAKDKVTVFTYELVVFKTDGDGNPLKGAEFTLYKHYETLTGDGSGNLTTVSKDEEVSKQAGQEQDDGKIKFNWRGLDAGKYRLSETVVPDGYTKAEDIYFEVVSKFDMQSDDPQFNSLKINILGKNWQSAPGKVPQDFFSNIDVSTGMITTDDPVISTTIQNKSGDLLPATGGIGTTLFYVFGSVLAIGAGVLLVSKKRMGAAE